MKYFCCDLRRLEIIKLSGSDNAIEFLEVHDHLEPVQALRQRTLFVRLLRPGFTLARDNILIDGGERLRTIPVEWAAAADNLPAGTDPALVDGIDDLPRTLVIRTTTFGDFSRYTLHLRAAAGSLLPPDGFDPRLSEIEFSFKVECPSDFDCAAVTTCPPKPADPPDIDYLAKDYTGFRRLMLDRLNLLVPEWTERSAADVGVTLSSCWPTRPTTCRTGRTRSPTRPIWQRRISVCRCAAMCGWSTTRCTTAATPAPGFIWPSTPTRTCGKARSC